MDVVAAVSKDGLWRGCGGAGWQKPAPWSSAMQSCFGQGTPGVFLRGKKFFEGWGAWGGGGDFFKKMKVTPTKNNPTKNKKPGG
ncbi:hypothetical protein, partial [uncultured Desulfovibrio sp.]|uniref:hypothetical protein n=1 Tax=uncultured Desulfovibrio sp. TaxID=167968 RepID=UPI00266F7906